MSRTLHAVSVAITLVAVVLIALGVLPMWLLTFGLGWQAAAVIIAFLLGASLLGAAAGRRTS